MIKGNVSVIYVLLFLSLVNGQPSNPSRVDYCLYSLDWARIKGAGLHIRKWLGSEHNREGARVWVSSMLVNIMGVKRSYAVPLWTRLYYAGPSPVTQWPLHMISFYSSGYTHVKTVYWFHLNTMMSAYPVGWWFFRDRLCKIHPLIPQSIYLTCETRLKIIRICNLRVINSSQCSTWSVCTTVRTHLNAQLFPIG